MHRLKIDFEAKALKCAEKLMIGNLFTLNSPSVFLKHASIGMYGRKGCLCRKRVPILSCEKADR
jgi:hypothetical protein